MLSPGKEKSKPHKVRVQSEENPNIPLGPGGVLSRASHPAGHPAWHVPPPPQPGLPIPPHTQLGFTPSNASGGVYIYIFLGWGSVCLYRKGISLSLALPGLQGFVLLPAKDSSCLLLFFFHCFSLVGSQEHQGTCF